MITNRYDSKYLLLAAEKHNWGLHAIGDWEIIEWKVYSDRSYAVYAHFNDMSGEQIVQVKSGHLRKTRFEKLLIAMDKEWIDPRYSSGGCDGVAWQIKQFSPDGEVIRTSGALNYIYSQAVLIEIVSLLPKLDDTVYYGYAFGPKQKKISKITNTISREK